MTEILLIEEINERFKKLSIRLKTLDVELNNARTDKLQKKAMYEKIYYETITTLKLKQPDLTQTDLKAEAVQQAHSARIEFILSDAKYNSLKLERERIIAKFLTG